MLSENGDIIKVDTTRGPFLERPGKLTGPVSYFEIKVSRKLGCVLTSNEVHFVSLAETLLLIFKSFQTPLWNGKQNSLTGPVITRSFGKRAPGARPLDHECPKRWTDATMWLLS